MVSSTVVLSIARSARSFDFRSQTAAFASPCFETNSDRPVRPCCHSFNVTWWVTFYFTKVGVP